MMDELQPPRKSVELEDVGAHELDESSESDEHFSDALEGRPTESDRSAAHSPIPRTRVERIDDKPAYGEEPGTSAYKMREQDAVPDEIEIIPDGGRSRSNSRLTPSDRPSTPTPSSPIPKTVVEKVDPDLPSHGEVPGTMAHELRKADAQPDVILKAPQITRKAVLGEPTSSISRSERVAAPQLDDPDEFQDFGPSHDQDGDAEGFGDDFDDFEQGGDEDFGDFDDGFQQAEREEEIAFEQPAPPSSSFPVVPSHPPLLNCDELHSVEEVVRASRPYVDELFPGARPDGETAPKLAPSVRSMFLTERSMSLWSQLIAPPPLQPPNWIRSRIRRLFLVSLGVPVDLDEILPASKQKKLVLPSLRKYDSPRPSTEGRANGAVERLRKGNDSSTSVGSTSSRAERKRRGLPPPPELDINSAHLLCSTTDAALHNLTDDELRAHVKRLEELQARASEVLEYWLKRKDSALGDKEAFEGVIANLVEHAKKVRK